VKSFVLPCVSMLLAVTLPGANVRYSYDAAGLQPQSALTNYSTGADVARSAATTEPVSKIKYQPEKTL
jgi:hypothetical protein